jgi:hypothetical protein
MEWCSLSMRAFLMHECHDGECILCFFAPHRKKVGKSGDTGMLVIIQSPAALHLRIARAMQAGRMYADVVFHRDKRDGDPAKSQKKQGKEAGIDSSPAEVLKARSSESRESCAEP